MSALRPFCAPGSALAPWVLLQTTDQASNAIADPSALTNTGTGFDASTGTFTWVMKGDSTQVDGYNDASARWTRKVADLYPDFDPTRDRIDLCMVDPSIPLLTGAEKYGIMLGLLDSAAGVAGGGWAFGFHPQTSLAMQEAQFGASSRSATGSFTGNAIQRAMGNFVTRPDGARLGLHWWYRIGGVWSQGADASTGATVNTDPSVWRIHVGHCHVSTTTGTPTMSTKVYHRRTRNSGLTGLP